jgi:hypothetical protein
MVSLARAVRVKRPAGLGGRILAAHDDQIALRSVAAARQIRLAWGDSANLLPKC